jgi:hypothetical protein
VPGEINDTTIIDIPTAEKKSRLLIAVFIFKTPFFKNKNLFNSQPKRFAVKNI